MSTFNTDLMKYIAYYSSVGYTLIDVPFIVDVDVSESTKPITAVDLHHSDNKVYVGSGEQSFLQLIKEDKLQCGKYMCLTPCVRDETTDDTHYKVFLKLELIHVLKSTDNKLNALTNVLNDAFLCNNKYLPNVTADVINKDNIFQEVDIYSNSLEVGSYGIREYSSVYYVYGTGCAYPRHNIAKENKEPIKGKTQVIKQMLDEKNIDYVECKPVSAFDTNRYRSYAKTILNTNVILDETPHN